LFREKSLVTLNLAPIGPALASTVASTYPVVSASSSVTYVYNPEFETFKRRTGVLRPAIGGERAETIGAGQFDVALSYFYVRLTTINGDDLSELVNRPLVGGRFIEVRVPSGVRLKDGRVATFVPVRVTADLDVVAHIVIPEITYGITPDLNVGVDLTADRLGRSVMRWALGATAQVAGQLSAGAVFLGRHELGRQTEPIARPFFFQIERNNIYDASIGLRYRFAESW